MFSVVRPWLLKRPSLSGVHGPEGDLEPPGPYRQCPRLPWHCTMMALVTPP